MKKKLSVSEQIENLKAKGVTFEYMDEDAAMRFLRNNSYYFKLKAYAKNYVKNPKTGKYVHLDFAYLVELSKLDMYLREMILEMCLDIEHLLKTKMLYDMSINDEEDGYHIVQKYFDAYPGTKLSIDQKADVYTVTADLAEKHLEDRYALWNVVEMLSFGKFVELYTLYYQEYKGINYSTYLGSIKFLRNAAAHSNCLLSSLLHPNGTKKFRKTKELMVALSKVKDVSDSSKTKKMTNPVIHDFVALLFVYNDLLKNSANRKMRDKRMEALDHFFNSEDGRMLKHKEYFAKNQVISEAYKYVSGMITYVMKQNKNPKHKSFL